MGSIKDRNGIDLTEAEDTKKRWQEYTEELYKKDLHDQDNHDGVITHLEPDILECEVKWALESITMHQCLFCCLVHRVIVTIWMEWGGRREEGSGWGTHVYLWRIHFDIWQN